MPNTSLPSAGPTLAELQTQLAEARARLRADINDRLADTAPEERLHTALHQHIRVLQAETVHRQRTAQAQLAGKLEGLADRRRGPAIVAYARKIAPTAPKALELASRELVEAKGNQAEWNERQALAKRARRSTGTDVRTVDELVPPNELRLVTARAIDIAEANLAAARTDLARWTAALRTTNTNVERRVGNQRYLRSAALDNRVAAERFGIQAAQSTAKAEVRRWEGHIAQLKDLATEVEVSVVQGRDVRRSPEYRDAKVLEEAVRKAEYKRGLQFFQRDPDGLALDNQLPLEARDKNIVRAFGAWIGWKDDGAPEGEREVHVRRLISDADLGDYFSPGLYDINTDPQLPLGQWRATAGAEAARGRISTPVVTF